MPATFAFTRDLTPADWCALPRAFKAGEVVQRLIGHDYGCTADDLQLGSVETVACTLEPDGGYPFFTVPIEHLTSVGEHGVELDG